jgi:hypothetical protein
MSIINEVVEADARPVIIRDIQDIPQINGEKINIGVLKAPIPLSSKIKGIYDMIIEKYS